jgi:hypothetical protein
MAAISNCTSVDKTFGPYAGSQCRGGFDFTLLFEESILSILPLALVLGVAPFRILYLWRKQTKVATSGLLYMKLVRIPSLSLYKFTCSHFCPVRMECTRHLRFGPSHPMGPPQITTQSCRDPLCRAKLRWCTRARRPLVFRAHALCTTIIPPEHVPPVHRALRYSALAELFDEPGHRHHRYGIYIARCCQAFVGDNGSTTKKLSTSARVCGPSARSHKWPIQACIVLVDQRAVQKRILQHSGH